jgi:HSP20 family protein
MRSRIQTIVLPPFEGAEFAEEIRRVFVELQPLFPETLGSEWSPALDVYETDEAVEIAVDLPGVEPAAVRVIAKGGAVLIAGEKSPRRGSGESSFHLVERGFGRFVRMIRVATPCDPARAQASLHNGELRITLPKIVERRGRAIPIAVEAGRR